MGHKNVCFSCRKAFNLGSDFDNLKLANCPECGVEMKLMSQRFRPPKSREVKKWETAQFLVERGFPYQHISDDDVEGNYVPYPENRREAEAFVEKYKDQKVDLQKRRP